MNIKEIRNFFSKPPKITYTYDTMELIPSIPTQKVYAGTNIISGYTIAGLFIACDNTICKFFDIRNPPPQPNLQFRMLNLKQRSHAIEIVLAFKALLK